MRLTRLAKSFPDDYIDAMFKESFEDLGIDHKWNGIVFMVENHAVSVDSGCVHVYSPYGKQIFSLNVKRKDFQSYFAFALTFIKNTLEDLDNGK